MRVPSSLRPSSFLRLVALLCVPVMVTVSGMAQMARVEFPATTTPVMWSSSVDPDDLGTLPDGVDLPHGGMVHALDQTAKGPVLVQLHPTEIVSNSHAVGNFLRSTVYAGPKGSVEIKGLNADTHLQSTTPSFLVRISGDDPELLRSRVHLIRMVQTKDRRVVANSSQNIFGGQHRKQYDDVAVTKVDVEPDTWVKVTPTEPLGPGEYAIAIMPKDVNLFPDAVYDFDVAFAEAQPEK